MMPEYPETAFIVNFHLSMKSGHRLIVKKFKDGWRGSVFAPGATTGKLTPEHYRTRKEAFTAAAALVDKLSDV